MKNSNFNILVVTSGFYYFGEIVESPTEGYISLTNASMSGGFRGGKGIAGVSRGDSQASITLDRFQEKELLHFPISAVIGILPCIDLYNFKNTILR
jgi:hypothetical protein